MYAPTSLRRAELHYCQNPNPSRGTLLRLDTYSGAASIQSWALISTTAN